MKKISAAIAYPTIPIIFLGGINSNRTPLYDTMGLAVTNHNETTRTETIIECSKSLNGLKMNFFLNGQKITGLRGQQILAAVKSFVGVEQNIKLTIRSTNYDIFSGSSDSGLAALFTALNDVLDLNYTKDALLHYAMKGSESAGRSLYGGLTLTEVKGKSISVTQLASEKDLEPLKLFSIPFNYESRITADEIHTGIVTNPSFKERVKKVPLWVNEIINSLKRKDFLDVLSTAEENIRNAHELLEGVGLIIRKQEIMELCKAIEIMRNEGIPAYYLIGGGNLVTIATINDYAFNVEEELNKKKWLFNKSKVASAPKLIKI
ncbi:MAG: hypothetical protein JXA54_14780 [Candidatus Heimdallarchaeota archaeon]|nr:hypothetical protein [Candidatus Heimdallarchaeota archaeon]